MQYWRSVLNEVIHKNDCEHDFLYTNQGSLGALLAEKEAPTRTSSAVARQSQESRIYRLGDQYPGLHLTRREAETLFWIVQDFTMRHAAIKMNLSIRTVEFYVKNLRLKLHCKTKKELVDKVLGTNLLQQLEKEGMNIVKH